MNKTKYIAAAVLVLLAACNPDDITVEEPDDPQNTEIQPKEDDFNGTLEPSTSADEDAIANTTFDYTVSVVFSDSGDATVTNAEELSVSINGNGVTITNGTQKVIKYELSGATANGYFKLYSGRKQALVLNGVSIKNPTGAAINNQSKKRTFVVVNGTNSLADGASYTATPATEDEKAAFFSEGQLIFSGSGSLTVTASGKAGITSDDYVRFMSSPTVKVTSTAGHAVRGKDYILVSDGTVEAATGATMKKGFASDSLVAITGGTDEILPSPCTPKGRGKGFPRTACAVPLLSAFGLRIPFANVSLRLPSRLKYDSSRTVREKRGASRRANLVLSLSLSPHRG